MSPRSRTSIVLDRRRPVRASQCSIRLPETVSSSSSSRKYSSTSSPTGSSRGRPSASDTTWAQVSTRSGAMRKPAPESRL
ncbi:hypothetical protein [Streptomyces amakusaensis]|uniref:Uncharacterized protein n=1 Tax=Streptomyces amakusaensis TaxID=67271 RepID=A0ABW0AER9_9ACTN